MGFVGKLCCCWCIIQCSMAGFCFKLTSNTVYKCMINLHILYKKCCACISVSVVRKQFFIGFSVHLLMFLCGLVFRFYFTKVHLLEALC